MPRMIIGTNWFRAYSHTSAAKDRFLKSYQTAANIADILEVFVNAGIDATMGGDLNAPMGEAIREAEQRTGKRIIRIITPHFNIKPGGPADLEPERVVAGCKEMDASFCFPHQGVTDALVDRRDEIIRDIDEYTALIRRYEMIPGLSTHMPESILYADNQGADIQSYVQPYNAAGFLMQVEGDWIMRIIHEAKKPVMTIKPLAAGRLLPAVGLGYVWGTLRAQDMVTIGTMTPDEAREVIELSLAFLEGRQPGNPLQTTRSKMSLTPA